MTSLYNFSTTLAWLHLAKGLYVSCHLTREMCLAII